MYTAINEHTALYKVREYGSWEGYILPQGLEPNENEWEPVRIYLVLDPEERKRKYYVQFINDIYAYELNRFKEKVLEIAKENGASEKIMYYEL